MWCLHYLVVVAIDVEKDLDWGIPLQRVHGYKLWHVHDSKKVMGSGHGRPPSSEDMELL